MTDTFAGYRFKQNALLYKYSSFNLNGSKCFLSATVSHQTGDMFTAYEKGHLFSLLYIRDPTDVK